MGKKHKILQGKDCEVGFGQLQPRKNLEGKGLNFQVNQFLKNIKKSLMHHCWI
jgi:hypothetical protein